MRVKSGCGCMTLKTGSVVIASLSVIWSIITVITASLYLSEIVSPDINITHDKVLLVKPAGIALIVYSIINAGFASLMIFGSVRRIPGYMFPWLANGFISLMSNGILALPMVIIGSIVLPIRGIFALIAFYSAAIALGVYLWLIVYSHYKDLLAEKYRYQNKPTEGKVFSQPMNPYHHV